MILSCAMLLQWLGEKRGVPALEAAAKAMDAAVDKVLENPATRTPDLGGNTGCQAFAERVAQTLQAT
jgi:3-isopropylmalate dehydrogenase